MQTELSIDSPGRARSRFVQEDLQMVPEADASGQRRALNNVTRWKARHIGLVYSLHHIDGVAASIT